MWNISRSNVYERKTRAAKRNAPAKRGPKPQVSDACLLERIRAAIAGSPFQGEGHRKIRAKLLRESGGVKLLRVSRGRVLRVMRENGLLSPERSPWRPEVKHDGRITTDSPNAMWGTDMTSTLLTTGRNGYIFAVMDHCAQDCVGIHVSGPGYAV